MIDRESLVNSFIDHRRRHNNHVSVFEYFFIHYVAMVVIFAVVISPGDQPGDAIVVGHNRGARSQLNELPKQLWQFDNYQPARMLRGPNRRQQNVDTDLQNVQQRVQLRNDGYQYNGIFL